MAIIKKLSLSTGGGIVSVNQQADQEPNTASILIGLGGTGISAIRTIKTQVYDRLKPDDPKSPVPKYQHIRFIGVDADEGSIGDSSKNKEKTGDRLLALDKKEFFSIANMAVGKGEAINETVLAHRPDLAWITKDVGTLNFKGAGAGGIRQVGRFLLFDKSAEFINKLNTEIDAAKLGLDGEVQVNIHIFSGLSGGTGAGTFLDVCYLIRDVLSTIGGNHVILGYFFMPDVNLSRIAMSEHVSRQMVQQNGYASLQELNYCMEFPKNGGDFYQIYQTADGKKSIPWNLPPVDMCHLVCATDNAGRVIKNAYDYAMQVTCEYVMDFLTYMPSEVFNLKSSHSNFLEKTATADAKKTSGYGLHYLTLGASCASIPLKEINTYLASSLFSAYTVVNRNSPQQKDVDDIVVGAWARTNNTSASIIDRLYESIKLEALAKVSEFTYYEGDGKPWDEMIDGDGEMVSHYDNQRSRHQGMITTNIDNMVDVNNESSLLKRLQSKLQIVITDINRGPIFGQKILSRSVSGYNIFNVISGLIETNNGYLEFELQQSENRQKNYECSRDDYGADKKRSAFDSRKKRYEDYEADLLSLEQHNQDIFLFEKLGKMLNELQRQLVDRSENYYNKLSEIFMNLTDTFTENYTILTEIKDAPITDGFTTPLISIGEIQQTLDDEIKSIDKANSFKGLIEHLIRPENQAKWERDDLVSKVICDFFVKTVFDSFAQKTITAFLQDKYGEKGETLIAKIYDEWMCKLEKEAVPLFYHNNNIYGIDQVEKRKHISVPMDSTEIQMAAEMITDEGWKVTQSGFTDRILFMNVAHIFPIGAYAKCQDFEREYFKASTPGRHFYEGNPMKGVRFSDWKKLPSLTPPSRMDLTSPNTPENIKQRIKDIHKLYQSAKDAHTLIIPDIDSDDAVKIMQFDPNLKKEVESINEFVKQLLAETNENKNQVNVESIGEKETMAKSIMNTKERINQIKEQLTDSCYVPIEGHTLFWGGDRQSIEVIAQDNLFNSPVLRMEVEDAFKDRAYTETLIQDIESSIQELMKLTKKQSEKDANDFFEALYTDVIHMEGRVITFTPVEDDFELEPITLSKRDEAFPYASIPTYQAFLSYLDLDDKIKKDIRNRTNEMMNGSEKTLKDICQILTSSLSDDKIRAWISSAEDLFPDEKDDIKEFLQNNRKSFRRHCTEYQ